MTCEGLRIHKEMENKGQSLPYNIETVFGFLDLYFLKIQKMRRSRDLSKIVKII
jgi:hypothetical protein